MWEEHIPTAMDMIIIRIHTIIMIRTGMIMDPTILIQILVFRTTITAIAGIIILIITGTIITMTAVLMRCGKVSGV